MSFFIDHPDEWIGVPERWPFPLTNGGVLSSPADWIRQVVDEIGESEGLDADVREHMTGILGMAVQRGITSGHRTFVAFETWSGPAYIVECESMSAVEQGTRSLEDFAGLDDRDQLGVPFAEEFTTTSGLTGVRCYRYLPYPGGVEGMIYGRADYVFRQADELLVFRSAEFDMVYFRRLLPALERLVASTSWADVPVAGVTATD